MLVRKKLNSLKTDIIIKIKKYVKSEERFSFFLFLFFYLRIFFLLSFSILIKKI